MEDLEASTKKNSGKITSQFLKFLVFRAQFWGSHYGNSQFRSEIILSLRDQEHFVLTKRKSLSVLPSFDDVSVAYFP